LKPYVGPTSLLPTDSSVTLTATGRYKFTVYGVNGGSLPGGRSAPPSADGAGSPPADAVSGRAASGGGGSAGQPCAARSSCLRTLPAALRGSA
jgi:hypothetical protein